MRDEGKRRRKFAGTECLTLGGCFVGNFNCCVNAKFTGALLASGGEVG